MSMTWQSDDIPPPEKWGALGWALVGLRGGGLILLILPCFLLLMIIRLFEAPLFGIRRPVTPHITCFVCRNALRIIGLGLRVEGSPMTHDGAVVANHSSWLDIFALNASKRIYFVSKSEVAGWIGIGHLARGVGTVFITRDPKEAKTQTVLFEERLLAGHKLLFFPEGTSTDGLRVLPFRSTLFAAFFAPALKDRISVQPVSVSYRTPADVDPRRYGWWGGMGFGPHLMETLARLRQGQIKVVYHPPLRVADYENRKALAAASEAIVRAGHMRGTNPQ
ncbi:MAG: lysophospholipid acyltransferase family protein [Pseudomonadota bacterium]